MKYAIDILNNRTNRVDDWLPTDSIENYKDHYRGSPNLYKPGQFTYSFNEDGFRSDSFSLPSELPIIFLGCSCTEGVGLPLEDTWSYRLITKIRQTTGKVIPYWSLATGGTGVDTQANYLYWLSQRIDFKYVFGLLPPSGRREYAYEHNSMRLWGPGNSNELVGRLFADKEYALDQDRRSIMLIDSIVKQKQAKIVLSNWFNHLLEIRALYDDFPDITFLRHNISNVDYARDSIHFGPTFHNQFADTMWDNVKSYF